MLLFYRDLNRLTIISDPIPINKARITRDHINIDKWPCPHNSKHFPLYSPFHSNLIVVAKLILPGIASILIPNE